MYGRNNWCKDKKGLPGNCNISYLSRSSELNTKLATSATKAELKVEQDTLKKLQASDPSFFPW